jgi:multiple sugar transport system permease protein
MAEATSAAKAGRRAPVNIWQPRRAKYLFILPALALIIGISIFPLLYSLLVSLTDWTAQNPEPSFIGLENYGGVIGDDPRWIAAMGRSLGMTVVAVIVELVLGFLLAQLLIDPLPGKRFIIPLMVLPAVTNPIVVGFIWKVLYNPSFGTINQAISWVVGPEFEMSWLANSDLALVAITIAEIWQWTPFMFLAMMAGLVGLHPELYEAAAIDGASRWQILLNITLPLMRPIIIVAVLIRGLDIMKVFDLVFVMTNGGPGTVTETISYYIYLLGFKFFRLGYGAAASYLLLVVLSIVVVFLLNRLSRQAR